MLRKIVEFALASLGLAALLFLAAVAANPAVPGFQLRDTRGTVHTPAEWSGHKAVLLFFVATDCPVANSYVPEMNRIQEAYGARGVAVFAVQADTTTAQADVARYAREYRYTFPLLLDPRQVLVGLTQAVAQVVEPEPLALFELHPRFDSRRPKIIDA